MQPKCAEQGDAEPVAHATNVCGLRRALMYGRWVKLLFVLVGLAVLSFFYFENEVQKAWVVADECRDYLYSLDDSWTSAGDVYWLNTCDSENPISLSSFEAQWRASMEAYATASLFLSLALLAPIALSLIGRWLVTGRLR
jgi:hypothetical protein